MNKRERLKYMVIGVVLSVAVLLIGMAVSPLTAQRDRFGDVTCTSLTVVDKDGKSVVRIFPGSEGGDVFIYAKEEELRVTMAAKKAGGGVLVFDKRGYPVTRMVVNELGNEISLSSENGSAYMKIGEYGGRVGVLGKGKGEAAMAVNEYGNGGISTWDKHGYRQ